MGQYREMVAQAQSDQSAQAEHQQMDAAMTQAASTNDGVSRQGLVGFIQHLQQANPLLLIRVSNGVVPFLIPYIPALNSGTRKCYYARQCPKNVRVNLAQATVMKKPIGGIKM